MAFKHLHSGFSAKVNILLVEEQPTRRSAFNKALNNSPYVISHAITIKSSLVIEVERHQPDVIIMDLESPSENLLDNLSQMSALCPKPVVMFADHQDTEVVNALINSGVSAFIAGEFFPNRLRSILDVALARFSQYQELKQELVVTKEKLSNQKTIEQAKIWLMEHKHYSEHEAYHRMRKMAMDNGQKLEEVAKNILSVSRLMESSF